MQDRYFFLPETSSATPLFGGAYLWSRVLDVSLLFGRLFQASITPFLSSLPWTAPNRAPTPLNNTHLACPGHTQPSCSSPMLHHTPLNPGMLFHDPSQESCSTSAFGSWG